MEGMEEVEVEDLEETGDDNVSVWTDAEEDNVEEVVEPLQEDVVKEDVRDDAVFVFKSHRDSTYCSAFHPTSPSTIITGGGEAEKKTVELSRKS